MRERDDVRDIDRLTDSEKILIDRIRQTGQKLKLGSFNFTILKLANRRRVNERWPKSRE